MNLEEIQKEVEYEQKILRKAIQEYGVLNQIFMLFEEMSELQKEIVKFKRATKEQEIIETQKNIIEEIADVTIMLEQIRIIFDIQNTFSKVYDFKINRLAERLDIQKD